MESSQPQSCSSGAGAQTRIPMCSQCLLSREHRLLTMEFGLSWDLLVAVLRGNSWRRRETEYVGGYDGEKQRMRDSSLI